MGTGRVAGKGPCENNDLDFKCDRLMCRLRLPPAAFGRTGAGVEQVRRWAVLLPRDRTGKKESSKEVRINARE